MRILLTNFHLKDGGGHKTYINYLFEFLINIGIEVYLACPKSSQLNSLLKKKFPDRVFDVEFPSKPREIINLIRNIFLLKKIISSKKINLIHVNGSPDHKIVALSKWLFGKDFKIIRTKHDSFPIKKSLTNKKLYKKYTDQMIVVSDYQFRSVITDSSLKKKTIVIKMELILITSHHLKALTL